MRGSQQEKDQETSKPLRVCWWNGGGAVRKRLSVNPGLGILIKSNPDIFTYGEAELTNTRGLFLSGYRFLFYR